MVLQRRYGKYRDEWVFLTWVIIKGHFPTFKDETVIRVQHYPEGYRIGRGELWRGREKSDK